MITQEDIAFFLEQDLSDILHIGLSSQTESDDYKRAQYFYRCLGRLLQIDKQPEICQTVREKLAQYESQHPGRARATNILLIQSCLVEDEKEKIEILSRETGFPPCILLSLKNSILYHPPGSIASRSEVEAMRDAGCAQAMFLWAIAYGEKSSAEYRTWLEKAAHLGLPSAKLHWGKTVMLTDQTQGLALCREAFHLLYDSNEEALTLSSSATKDSPSTIKSRHDLLLSSLAFKRPERERVVKQKKLFEWFWKLYEPCRYPIRAIPTLLECVRYLTETDHDVIYAKQKALADTEIALGEEKRDEDKVALETEIATLQKEIKQFYFMRYHFAGYEFTLEKGKALPTVTQNALDYLQNILNEQSPHHFRWQNACWMSMVLYQHPVPGLILKFFRITMIEGKAVVKDHVAAITSVGRYTKEKRYLEEAIRQGDAVAQYYLARLLEQEATALEEEYLRRRSLELYQQSAASGYVPAFYPIAQWYRDQAKLAEARQWFFEAAKAGDAEGTYEFAELQERDELRHFLLYRALKQAHAQKLDVLIKKIEEKSNLPTLVLYGCLLLMKRQLSLMVLTEEGPALEQNVEPFILNLLLHDYLVEPSNRMVDDIPSLDCARLKLLAGIPSPHTPFACISEQALLKYASLSPPEAALHALLGYVFYSTTRLIDHPVKDARCANLLPQEVSVREKIRTDRQLAESKLRGIAFACLLTETFARDAQVTLFRNPYVYASIQEKLLEPLLEELQHCDNEMNAVEFDVLPRGQKSFSLSYVKQEPKVFAVYDEDDIYLSQYERQLKARIEEGGDLSAIVDYIPLFSLSLRAVYEIACQVRQKDEDKQRGDYLALLLLDTTLFPEFYNQKILKAADDLQKHLDALYCIRNHVQQIHADYGRIQRALDRHLKLNKFIMAYRAQLLSLYCSQHKIDFMEIYRKINRYLSYDFNWSSEAFIQGEMVDYLNQIFGLKSPATLTPDWAQSFVEAITHDFTYYPFRAETNLGVYQQTVLNRILNEIPIHLFSVDFICQMIQLTIRYPYLLGHGQLEHWINSRNFDNFTEGLKIADALSRACSYDVAYKILDYILFSTTVAQAADLEAQRQARQLYRVVNRYNFPGGQFMQMRHAFLDAHAMAISQKTARVPTGFDILVPEVKPFVPGDVVDLSNETVVLPSQPRSTDHFAIHPNTTILRILRKEFAVVSDLRQCTPFTFSLDESFLIAAAVLCIPEEYSEAYRALLLQTILLLDSVLLQNIFHHKNNLARADILHQRLEQLYDKKLEDFSPRARMDRALKRPVTRNIVLGYQLGVVECMKESAIIIRCFLLDHIGMSCFRFPKEHPLFSVTEPSLEVLQSIPDVTVPDPDEDTTNRFTLSNREAAFLEAIHTLLYTDYTEMRAMTRKQEPTSDELVRIRKFHQSLFDLYTTPRRSMRCHRTALAMIDAAKKGEHPQWNSISHVEFCYYATFNTSDFPHEYFHMSSSFQNTLSLHSVCASIEEYLHLQKLGWPCASERLSQDFSLSEEDSVRYLKERISYGMPDSLSSSSRCYPSPDPVYNTFFNIYRYKLHRERRKEDVPIIIDRERWKLMAHPFFTLTQMEEHTDYADEIDLSEAKKILQLLFYDMQLPDALRIIYHPKRVLEAVKKCRPEVTDFSHYAEIDVHDERSQISSEHSYEPLVKEIEFLLCMRSKDFVGADYALSFVHFPITEAKVLQLVELLTTENHDERLLHRARFIVNGFLYSHPGATGELVAWQARLGGDVLALIQEYLSWFALVQGRSIALLHAMYMRSTIHLINQHQTKILKVTRLMLNANTCDIFYSPEICGITSFKLFTDLMQQSILLNPLVIDIANEAMWTLIDFTSLAEVTPATSEKTVEVRDFVPPLLDGGKNVILSALQRIHFTAFTPPEVLLIANKIEEITKGGGTLLDRQLVAEALRFLDPVLEPVLFYNGEDHPSLKALHAQLDQRYCRLTGESERLDDERLDAEKGRALKRNPALKCFIQGYQLVTLECFFKAICYSKGKISEAFKSPVKSLIAHLKAYEGDFLRAFETVSVEINEVSKTNKKFLELCNELRELSGAVIERPAVVKRRGFWQGGGDGGGGAAAAVELRPIGSVIKF